MPIMDWKHPILRLTGRLLFVFGCVRVSGEWLGASNRFWFLLKLISAFLHSTEPSLLGSGGYPFVASPEFPPTNGTVVPAVPGTPTAPAIAPESWKTTNTGPQSLMKEPPIAVANRNATTQFATQGQQQAAVMMVYGLDNTTSNTDKLFNLVCLYGKSIRRLVDIDFQLFARFSYRKCCADKIPKNQRRNSHGANGWTRRRRALCTALEQHSDRKQWKAANCVRLRNSYGLLRNDFTDRLNCYSFSKQNFLSEVTNPYSLPDHSPSFKEYTGSKNNRFLSLAQACKNRIQPPSKVSLDSTII